MAKKDPYTEFLKEDFKDLFGQLDLTDVQRKFLNSRWLDQVLWMEKKANVSRDRHYRLRLSAIILGVIVPILIGINVDPERKALWQTKQSITIGLSAVVAISAAVEEFFHYGERWYHYRRTVESLKTRSEEHTSELQSQSTISYAVFCLKKKKQTKKKKKKNKQQKTKKKKQKKEKIANIQKST